MLLLPIRHEKMQGRRWPVITVAVIALNFVAFLGTHWRIEAEDVKTVEVRAHILMLSAMHPELTVTADAQEFVAHFRQKSPDVWKRVGSPTRPIADRWDAKMRSMEDPTALQGEMNSLDQQYSELLQESILQRYAVVPAHPAPISYLTANFLHGGWLHIIGNMWFLWLAGTVLEDTWGRVIYPIFYLLSGAMALLFHVWSDPTSLVATLGASGAVAALLGAFLVRFPQTKIEMRWYFGFFLRSYKFTAMAYWLLPLWLAMEIFSGTIFGASSGVAHWAHVGGFVFGAVGAVGLRYSGLEHAANQAIESKVSWTADPAIVQATGKMEQGKLDEAIALLEDYVAGKPDALEAYSILPPLYFRKNDIPKFLEATIKVCQLHLKAKDIDAAWEDYGEYLNSGGEQMPAATWLELCRAAEGQQRLERAVAEYDRLAKTYPSEKQSLLALMAAGRLSLKQSQPAEALRFFQAAMTSEVPHLDWETSILGGIREAEKALAAEATGVRP
jgi:membrane associated rhomboid family serine protease